MPEVSEGRGRAETVRYLREVTAAVHGVNPKCLVGCQLGTLDQYGDGRPGSGLKAALALYGETKDFIQLYGAWWPPDGKSLIRCWKEWMLRRQLAAGEYTGGCGGRPCCEAASGSTPSRAGRARPLHGPSLPRAGRVKMRYMAESRSLATPAWSDLGLHVMAKPIGPLCNLACTYCFYRGNQSLYPPHEPWRMSDATLEAYVRQYIAAQPEAVEVIEFAFQGGEPTLMGLDWFRRVVELQRKHVPAGQADRQLASDQRDLVGRRVVRVSQGQRLPGGPLDRRPRRTAQRLSPGQAGGPTFERVMRAMECLRKHAVPFNALTCIHRANGDHPARVYRFLARLRHRVHAVHPGGRATPGGDAGRSRRRAAGRDPGHRGERLARAIRTFPLRGVPDLGPPGRWADLRPRFRPGLGGLAGQGRLAVRLRAGTAAGGWRWSTTATCTVAITTSSPATGWATSTRRPSANWPARPSRSNSAATRRRLCRSTAASAACGSPATVAAQRTVSCARPTVNRASAISVPATRPSLRRSIRRCGRWPPRCAQGVRPPT